MKEIELFRLQKHVVIEYVKRNGMGKISSFCATTGFPLIVVYTYVMEELTEYEEMCKVKIAELKAFYGYED